MKKNLITNTLPKSWITGLIVAVFFAIPVFAGAALPEGFELEVLHSGLNLPTDIVYSNDKTLLFIAEKDGVVKVAENGVLQIEPVIVLQNINTYNDKGLLSIALDPNFDTSPYLYLSYTYENSPADFTGPKTAQIIRVLLDANHIAISGTEEVLVGSIVGDAISPSCLDFPSGADCIASDSPSHTVADLSFGPDGYLYASIGDGSSFSEVDPFAHRALDLDSLNGKVLRINTDGTAPIDNPYYTGDPNANRSKVWNLGLRNPFRISFRPSNGSLYIGDVGWFMAEEINLGGAGANFGWPCQEGNGQTPGYDCIEPGAANPLYTYSHDANGAGSITGGVFYNGINYPSEFGDTYFFGDFAQSWIKRLVVDANDNFISVEDFMTDAGGPVGFNIDADGDIVYISIYSGEIRKIKYTLGNRAPIVEMSATPTAGLTPLLVNFSSVGTSDPDGDVITYFWDFGNGKTSTRVNPRHRYRNEGVFTAKLTVTDIFGASSFKEIVITVGNEPPVGTITAPADGSFYQPDETIFLSATGNDLETGPLPESAFEWTIILHHNVHVHIMETLTGSSPTFSVPDHGASDETLFVEAELVVTDVAGLTDTTSISLFQAHAPTITLIGANPVNVALNGVFTDPGATALDNEDGDVTANIVVGGDTVDTSIMGVYTVTYNVTDSDGFPATEVMRNVIVSDVWFPISPNGAMHFDGVDDYIELFWWDIEEDIGFTLESRFVAESFSGDDLFISKSSSVSDVDWAMGLREVSPTEASIVFKLTTDGITHEVLGGTVLLDVLTHIAVVYDLGSMIIYQDGVEVASVPTTGATATGPNVVWLGGSPLDPTIGGFHGLIDEMRVWNRARTGTEILDNKDIEQPGPEFNLIKNWKFNEGGGQVAFDVSGAGHHGRLGSTSIPDASDPIFIAGEMPNGGVFDPTHFATILSPALGTVGEEIAIDAQIRNLGDGVGNLILNLEIRDSSDVIVLGDNTGIETFLPGETKTIPFFFTPTSADTYEISYGLTYPFWDGLYEWAAAATTFNVVAGGGGNVAPVITLLGDNPLNLIVGDTYTDPGATATDVEDGDITTDIVVGGDVVDTATVGTYTVTYNVIDSETLAAAEVTRDVIVTDEVPTGDPFIELISSVSVPAMPLVGEEVVTTVTVRNTGGAGAMVLGLMIFDEGVAVYSEDYANEPFAAGEEKILTITYTPTHIGKFGIDMGIWSEDWAAFQEWMSHIGEFTAVEGGSNTAPMITLLGDNPLNLIVGDIYTDPGATAADAEDGDITTNIVVGGDVVDTATVGTYTVTYNVVDSETLAAAEVTRDVVVEEGVPAVGITIYEDDNLQSGWASWSWDVTTDFAATTEVSNGATALQLDYTNPWGGLFLHHDSIDTTGLTNLAFDIHGGITGGQELQIISLDENIELIVAIPLANYINPITLGWQSVTIPLADLGILESITTGFIIQDISGGINPTLYLDTLELQ